MSRKFTIKVAGCEWKLHDKSRRIFILRDQANFYGSVQKIGHKKWIAHPLRRPIKNVETMSAAKAYVIKQLAGEGKEKKK